MLIYNERLSVSPLQLTFSKFVAKKLINLIVEKVKLLNDFFIKNLKKFLK